MGRGLGNQQLGVLAYLEDQHAAAEVAHLSGYLGTSPRRTRAVVGALARRGLVKVCYTEVPGHEHLVSGWVFLTGDYETLSEHQLARWGMTPTET